MPWAFATQRFRFISHSLHRRASTTFSRSFCVRCERKTPFLLRAHLVLLSGDTPGITKLLHLTGHNARAPCRACKLVGTPYKYEYKFKDGRTGHNTQHYYPLQPPIDPSISDPQRRRQCRHPQNIVNLPPERMKTIFTTEKPV